VSGFRWPSKQPTTAGQERQPCRDKLTVEAKILVDLKIEKAAVEAEANRQRPMAAR
jgi:hypothetical protein